MPVIHKSTIKRARQAEVRRDRNRSTISGIRTLIKKTLAAVDSKQADVAATALKKATAALSKAANKGVLKPNTVSRRVSRLTRRVNSLSAK
ncbi:MAG: 30S ribosomal protein S20 [Nitrospiraceae bacterium]